MTSEAIPQSDRALLEAQAQAGQAGVKAYEAAKAQLDRQQQQSLQHAAEAAQARGGPAGAMESQLSAAKDIYQTRQSSLTQAGATAERRQSDRDRRAVDYQNAVLGARSLIQDQAAAAAEPIRLRSDYEVAQLRQNGENAVSQIEMQMQAEAARFEMEMRAAEEAARREEERFNRQLAASRSSSSGGSQSDSRMSASEGDISALVEQLGIGRLEDVSQLIGGELSNLAEFDGEASTRAGQKLVSAAAKRDAVAATVAREMFREYVGNGITWEDLNEIQKRWTGLFDQNALLNGPEGPSMQVFDDDLTLLAKLGAGGDADLSDTYPYTSSGLDTRKSALRREIMGQLRSQNSDAIDNIQTQLNSLPGLGHLNPYDVRGLGDVPTSTWSGLTQNGTPYGSLPPRPDAIQSIYNSLLQGSKFDNGASSNLFSDAASGEDLFNYAEASISQIDPTVDPYVQALRQLAEQNGVQITPDNLDIALGLELPLDYMPDTANYDPENEADKYLLSRTLTNSDRSFAGNMYQMAMNDAINAQGDLYQSQFKISDLDWLNALNAAQGKTAFDASTNGAFTVEGEYKKSETEFKEQLDKYIQAEIATEEAEANAQAEEEKKQQAFDASVQRALYSAFAGYGLNVDPDDEVHEYIMRTSLANAKGKPLFNADTGTIWLPGANGMANQNAKAWWDGAGNNPAFWKEKTLGDFMDRLKQSLTHEIEVEENDPDDAVNELMDAFGIRNYSDYGNLVKSELARWMESQGYKSRN